MREEFHNLYTAPNIAKVIKSRRMRLAGHVARIREMENMYSILVGRSEGKRPLVRPRCRWEDNIRMDLREEDERVWTVCIWLRIGTSGGFL
jgi:hypothetical protein